MRRIAHISDLHFGAEDPLVAEGLLEDLATQNAALVAISGDLTQRARTSQFRAARTYLDRIPAPQLIVPGNHDIPLHNVVDRLIRPLTRYRHWITPDVHPVFQDEELAVVGVNTARSTTWKEGRISVAQIVRMQAQFLSVPADRFKILVSHHPFLPPEDRKEAVLVGRVKLALKALEASGCSLILSGHLHRAYGGDVRVHHLDVTRSILVAQAGTAISHRLRNEANAYNLITLNGSDLTIEVRTWSGRLFEAAETRRYRQTPEGWSIAPPGKPSSPSRDSTHPTG